MTPRDALPYLEYTTKAGAKDRIYADAVQSEGLVAASAVTEHAAEDGSVNTDLIRPEQLTGDVVLYFSETPIRGDLDDKLRGQVDSIALPKYKYPELTPLLSPKGVTDLAKSGVSAVASLVGLGGPAAPTHYSALKFSAAPGRFRTVFAKLMQLRAESSLVTLGLTFARVKNLALEEISVARKPEDGIDGAIAIKVRQVSFVTTKSAKAAPLPLEPRGQPPKDSITVGASEVPPGPGQTIIKGIGAKAGL